MKLQKLFFINLTVFLLLGQMLVNAQTSDKSEKMEFFNFLLGDWTVKNLKLNKENSWELLGVTSSKNSMVLGGKFVKENVKYLSDFGEINMITYIGYDSRVKSYKLSAMDKEYGVMDIYLGQVNGKSVVFTNLNSDSPFIMKDGKQLWFKLTYKDITENSFTHLVEGTLDKGKTWFMFSKANFKRKPN